MIRSSVLVTTVAAVWVLTGCTANVVPSPTTHTAPATGSVTRTASEPVPAIMLNPAVTQASIGQTICKPGWTRTIRPRLPTRRGYQNDHIVSLELGGAPTNPLNLRFVPLTRARHDDILENSLHRQVCAHTIPLVVAQQQIIAAKHDE